MCNSNVAKYVTTIDIRYVDKRIFDERTNEKNIYVDRQSEFRE